MKKKTLVTAIVSIIMVAAVTLVVGLTTSFSPVEDQNVSFNMPVTVTDDDIIYDEEPVYFESIGGDVSFDISASSPDGIDTGIEIYVGDPDSPSPITGTVTANGEFYAVIQDNNKKDVYIQLDPVYMDDVSPDDYSIGYEINVSSTEKTFDGWPLVTAVFVLVLAVFLIINVNSSSKNYDERQLAARGEAAMNAFAVSLLCCLAVALLSKATKSFPLSVYESTIIIAMVGSTTFAILADINDAYVGLKIKRGALTALAWIGSIVALIGSGMVGLGMGFSYDIARTGLVVAICLVIAAIELTVKGIIEKRGDPDEES